MLRSCGDGPLAARTQPRQMLPPGTVSGRTVATGKTSAVHPSPASSRSLLWPVLGAIGLAVLVAFVVVEIYAFRTPTSEVETQVAAPGSTTVGTGTGSSDAPTSLPVTTPPGPTAASTTTTAAKGVAPPQAPAGCENVGAVVTTG